MVQHLDLDKPTLLSAVYRKPWMIRAAAAKANRARAAAAAKAHAMRAKQGSSAACSRQGAASNSSDADFSDNEEGSSGGGGRYMAPWHHEALLLMLELSTRNSQNSSSSSSVSPAPAMAAVRGYLTVAEAAQQVSNGWKAVASVLPGSAKMQAAAAAAAVSGSAVRQYTSHSSSYDTLQQLLAACPLLTLLPRDVLLSRWQLLLSGLLGSHQTAAALLMSSPYIVVSYADLQDSGCPYELQGFF
jgi:hypothetical protein